MVKNIDFTIFVFVRRFLHLLVHLLDCSFVHWSVCCGRVVVWSFGRLFVWSCVREPGRLFAWLFLLSVAFSFARVFVWSIVRLVFWPFVRVFFYSICLFFVFLEGRLPEAAYFYGISQYSKFTLRLLQLTDKEVINATNENGKASIQRLAENIANLDPEVILLYINDEKIQLLMTQMVC